MYGTYGEESSWTETDEWMNEWMNEWICCCRRSKNANRNHSQVAWDCYYRPCPNDPQPQRTSLPDTAAEATSPLSTASAEQPQRRCSLTSQPVSSDDSEQIVAHVVRTQRFVDNLCSVPCMHCVWMELCSWIADIPTFLFLAEFSHFLGVFPPSHEGFMKSHFWVTESSKIAQFFLQTLSFVSNYNNY